MPNLTLQIDNSVSKLN